MIKVATHDGGFHTDEVFAVAVILLVEPEAQIVRSRDVEMINSADYVVDVGLEYDPSRRKFDHHQPGGAGKRPNGIEYASFGLVWKEYGARLCGGEREAEIIDRELIQPIDAHDNGIAIASYKFEGVRDYAIGDFFSSYITGRDTTPERIYEIFVNLVEIAKGLIGREIIKAKDAVAGEDKLKEIYASADDKRIIEIPDDSLPWRQVLSNFPEPVYIVYPRKDGSFGVKAVPDYSSNSYGKARKDLPESWGGKTDAELRSITGVSDAIFAHRALFMCAAKSKEGALELAKKALNA